MHCQTIVSASLCKQYYLTELLGGAGTKMRPKQIYPKPLGDPPSSVQRLLCKMTVMSAQALKCIEGHVSVSMNHYLQFDLAY